jgi:hypothetical protein
MRILLLFLLFSSCALLEEQKKMIQSIAVTWKGKPVADLDAHPYFKTLNFKNIEDSAEVYKRTYYRRAKFLSGGAYIESGDCYHVFRIKKKLIDQYRQQGNCREDNKSSTRLIHAKNIP